jgi:hypothetical protein
MYQFIIQLARSPDLVSVICLMFIPVLLIHGAGCMVLLQIPVIQALCGAAFLPLHDRKQSKGTSERVAKRVFVVIVTKGSNVNSVRRSAAALLEAVQGTTAIPVILTDEPNDKAFKGSGLQLVTVPRFFVASRAKYKARALEYFRTALVLTPDDWVLHLDEESIVDAQAIQRCYNFIRHEVDFDIGQGLILYNSRNTWKNWFLTAADILRIRDDLGKLYLQSFVVHKPWWGLRGSFLLLRGNVEQEVGWDTDCLTEDYCFSARVSQWWVRKRQSIH